MNIFYLGLILMFLTSQQSSAEHFFVLGTKPLSMAGAYVSVEDNQSAFYWNPAKYSFNKTASFELPLGIELIATHDIVKELDDVEQALWKGPESISEVNDLRKKKMGLIVHAYRGISLQYHNYGLSFLEQRLAAGNPYFKKIDQYSEEPYLQIKYIELQEYIIGSSRLVGDNLYLGANIKLLVGETNYASFHASDKDVEKKVKDSRTQGQTTTNLGLDMGLIYRQTENLNMGLLIRNLNSPKFSYPSSTSSTSLEDYQLKRQIRVGISYKTKRQTVLALDGDVIKNDTLLQDYQSQNLSVGLKYPLYKEHVVLRCGGMKNLVENDIGNVYTLGLGLNFLNLQADISAGVSSKKTKRSKTGDKYPVNLTASCSLSWGF